MDGCGIIRPRIGEGTAGESDDAQAVGDRHGHADDDPPACGPPAAQRPSPSPPAPERKPGSRPLHDTGSTTSAFAIPGRRVIRSDARRFWASRVEPFPQESEWYAPPYRTVDGDTFEQLQAEVALQEEAAERQGKASGEDATGKAGQAGEEGTA